MTRHERPGELLAVRGLHAYYGNSHVLHGFDLDVGQNEVVSLLGRNGAGRSTAAKAIMGEVRTAGSLRFRGVEIAGLASHRIARLGIGYVPENRDIFPGLTVRENLLLGVKDTRVKGRWGFKDVWALFPRLKERMDTPGGALSGGEQQMLSICRTLMGNPELIIVDEPTEGLAPAMVATVGGLLREIASRGMSVLLVEQKLAIALSISDKVYVMGHGRTVFAGTPDEFRNRPEVRKEWLEV